MVKSQYLSHIQTDHYAISRESLAHQLEGHQLSKIGAKQIQDGGWPPSWKYMNRCISAISRPICTKFGLQRDIRRTRVAGAAILNLDFWPYLSHKWRYYCLITLSKNSIDYCKKTQFKRQCKGETCKTAEIICYVTRCCAFSVVNPLHASSYRKDIVWAVITSVTGVCYVIKKVTMS